MAALCTPIQPFQVSARHVSRSTNKVERVKCSARKSGNSALLWTAAATTVLGLGYGLFHAGEATAAEGIRESLSGREVGELGMGPEGPLVEEFWDNMKRYAMYFITVATGGFYTVFKPIFDLLTNPATAALALVIVFGSLYLVYLTLNAMLSY